MKAYREALRVQSGDSIGSRLRGPESGRSQESQGRQPVPRNRTTRGSQKRLPPLVRRRVLPAARKGRRGACRPTPAAGRGTADGRSFALHIGKRPDVHQGIQTRGQGSDSIWKRNTITRPPKRCSARPRNCNGRRSPERSKLQGCACRLRRFWLWSAALCRRFLSFFLSPALTPPPRKKESGGKAPHSKAKTASIGRHTRATIIFLNSRETMASSSLRAEAFGSDFRRKNDATMSRNCGREIQTSA